MKFKKKKQMFQNVLECIILRLHKIISREEEFRDKCNYREKNEA